MRDLKLESLRIQNFRTFRDLTIDRLGRVNLVVGKNNVGKTSLLEAIDLYVQGGTKTSMRSLAQSRNLDGLDTYRSTAKSEFGVHLPASRHLFFGRPDLSMLGPDDEEPDIPPIEIESKPNHNQALKAWLAFSSTRNVEMRFEVGGEPGVSSRVLGEKTLSVFLSARDVRAEAEKYWDTIGLTDHEDRVAGALRIIDDVEGIRMASPPPGNGASNRSKSFPIARLKGQDRPEPLSNLGEGMNRLFALSVGLVRAEGGVLLVDEIENGLHYSVQPKLWRMIFETAQALDVQVFATTHSLDCLRAFKQVAQDRDGTESNLISLRRHEDDRENIVAVIADRDDLRAILGGKVEVR